MKNKIDKEDVDKLVPVPVILSKLSDDDAVKKTEYNKLVKKKLIILLLLILVKKIDYNTKISKIGNEINDHDHDKYITTQEFNKLTWGSFTARLKQANLASKTDIANFVNKTDFDNKLIAFNKKWTRINQNMYLLKLN